MAGHLDFECTVTSLDNTAIRSKVRAANVSVDLDNDTAKELWMSEKTVSNFSVTCLFNRSGEWKTLHYVP